MSTMFDTSVYKLRNGAPFVAPQVLTFIKNKACNGGAVRLSCRYRHSVASRLWWELAWEEDGETWSVSAQDWELCFWRAIQRHKIMERQRELEYSVSKGCGFQPGALYGWEHGDGI